MLSNAIWTIDLSLADKLKEILLTQGFELSKPPYTVFSGKKKGLSCTLYESGKLMVQGKDKKEFIEYYIEPEIVKNTRYSYPEAHLDLTPRIGLDEAGKGDFFGPLCIAGLYADGEGIKKLLEMGVKDSKQLNDENILKIARKIRVGFIHKIMPFRPETYNDLYSKFHNLNRLMAWAHTTTLGDLIQQTGCKEAILDQFADPSLVDRFVQQKKLDVHLVQRVRGEEDIVVAGASILARAAFVEGIDRLGEEIGTKLPKGASAIVKSVAKELKTKFGPDIFSKIAKTHFKTASEI